jgi:hypothetical protein
MSDNKIETKDLIESLGYKPEDFKSVDEFREKISTDWIRKANAEKDEGIKAAIIGTFANRIEKVINNGASEFGIKLTDDDFREAKYSDERAKIVLGKIKSHFDTTTSELKKLADSKGKEFAGEIQTKYETLEKNYNSVLGLNKDLEKQVTEKEKAANETIKAFKISDYKTKSEEKARGFWKDNPSTFEVIGFKKTIEDKYDVEIDDKEGAIVFDKATKQRIKNPNVVNSFLSYDQVIEMELKAAGLDKKNPHGGDKKPANPFVGNEQGGNGQPPKKMLVNPAFFKKD